MKEHPGYKDFNFDEGDVDFAKWLNIVLSKWLIIVLCILVAFFIAYIINNTSTPQFQVHTTLLVKPNYNPMDETPLTQISSYTSETQINNEIGILTSDALISRVIKKQDFWIKYNCIIKGLFNNNHFNCPFTIEFDKYHPQLINARFELRFLSDTTYSLTTYAENGMLYNYVSYENEKQVANILIDTTGKIQQTLTLPTNKFVLIPKKHIDYETVKNNTYLFEFKSLESLKSEFRKFSVDHIRNSSILKITLKSNDKNRAALFLNELTMQYLLKGIEQENLIAFNTIQFIDNQLISITDSLSSSEQQLENFRQKNKMLNIDLKAQQAFAKMDKLQTEKNQLIVKLSYIDYLKKSIGNENETIENLILPSTLSINDNALSQLVNELVDLFKEYSESLLNTKKNNPYITSLEQKISYTKEKLNETIGNIEDITELAIKNNNKFITETSHIINKLPQDQRKLLNIERKFQLNDELYTYLLTKRSEMQIIKASNLPDNEVLDMASPKDSELVFPNKKMNYALAIIIGGIVPVGFIILIFSINQKVRNIDELKQLTNTPVISHVFKDINPFTSKKEPNSAIQESLRTLRANLQFVIQEDKPNIIMVSSAIPGEGKSYISQNLANIYHLFGKKVCVADFDLRKGKLSQSFNLMHDKGISTVLSGRHILSDIVYTSTEGFDILPAGSIPPNPGVLIASDNSKELLQELKNKYNIIIVDTPPIGIVSDALFLSPLVDLLLFITRYETTPIPVLKHVFNELDNKKITNWGIVFNAVPNKKSNYGYAYGYGYYSNDTYLKRRLKKIKSRWEN